MQTMDRDTVEEIKRHFSIVVEEVRSDVQAVAEAVSGHRQEFRQELELVRGDLDEVKAMIRLS
jgi:hypothetical protein